MSYIEEATTTALTVTHTAIRCGLWMYAFYLCTQDACAGQNQYFHSGTFSFWFIFTSGMLGREIGHPFQIKKPPRRMAKTFNLYKHTVVPHGRTL